MKHSVPSVFNIKIEVHPDGSATVEDLDRKTKYSRTYWYDACRDIERKLLAPIVDDENE